MAVQNFQLLTWDGVKQKRIDSESTEIKFGKVSLAVVGDVAAAFAQEASDRSAGDAATLASAQSYTDAAITAAQGSLGGDISQLQADLTQEIADRAAGDASTLSSAQAYADQKIADLVGAAPQTLDTLKEIADAIANDASIAATLTASIAAVQAEVDAEETRALAAESALDGRLDVIEGSGAGSVAKAQLDAQAYADAAVLVEKNRAQAAEATKVSKAGDTMTGKLNLLSGLDVTGRVEFKDFADGTVVTIEPSLASIELAMPTVLPGYVSVMQPGQYVASLMNEAGDASLAQTNIEPGIISLYGAGTTPAVPTEDFHAVNKKYVDDAVAVVQGEVDAAEASIAQEILDRAAAVSAEQARAEAAELALQGEVDAVEAALAQELLDRAAADTTLQGNIDAVAGDLAQELLDRAAADTALQGEIDAEEARALAAEAALQGEIDAEEVARAAADTALQGEIDALEVVVSELNLISKTADAAISAGQICYVKSNGNVAPADADLDLSDAALVVASANIASGASGKVVIKEGSVVGGFSGLVPGKKCFVSKTAGEVVQSLTGFASGNSVYCVGRAISATEIAFQPVYEFEY